MSQPSINLNGEEIEYLNSCPSHRPARVLIGQRCWCCPLIPPRIRVLHAFSLHKESLPTRSAFCPFNIKTICILKLSLKTTETSMVCNLVV